MPDTPARPLPTSAPSAVAGSGRDAAVAAHYGDPFTEQRALVERTGIVDRNHREVLAVTGEDRLSWLHTLTTQHTAALAAKTGTDALILTPLGRIAHHALITEDGSTTWLDTEPGAAGALLEFLSTMRFLLRVQPRDMSAEWAVLSVLGPDTRDVLVRAGLVSRLGEGFDPRATIWPVYALNDDARAGDSPGGGSLAGGWLRQVAGPTPHAFDVVLPRARLASVRDGLCEAGAALCGLEAYEALRVAARRPRLAGETDDRTMPHEARWVSSAVALDKGCYPGQETVAKVHNLGQPPRRLVLLHFDGSSDQLPASGQPVLCEGREVGFIGTAVRHYELGNVALALLKRGIGDHAVLEVDGMRAAIDPDPDTGSVSGGGEAGAGRRAVAEFTARRRGR